MIWENRHLSDVTEQDVRSLLESQIEEHKHLEYKADLYATNDAGQKDFLIDVCAFANAEGGILLIGIPELRDAKDGKPTGIPDLGKFQGIDAPNPEAVLVGYDSRVVASIEDRLALESQTIKLSNGKYVLAIRIPNSLNKPHCVRRGEARYFPVRRDRNLYYMDVQEVKDLVMRTASQQDKAEDLLREAMREVTQYGGTPVMTFATIPVFSRNFLIDFRDEKIVDAMRRFDLTGSSTYGDCDFSFKGLERRVPTYKSVAQLRTNGLLLYTQQVPSLKFDDKVGFFPTAVDTQLYNFVVQAVKTYKSARLTGPYSLALTLTPNTTVVGLYPPPGLTQGYVERGSLENRLYAFPTMYAPDFSDVGQIIRPLCDQLHQAFGEEHSPKIDFEGKWVP